MSFNYNYKMWISTKRDLEHLIKRQDVLKLLPPLDNPPLTYRIFSELYVLYVELINKLTHCYLYTLRVQKRKVLRTLVDAAVNRLLELKAQLQELELNEYVYVDKALITRKLQPSILMIWKSPNFLFRRPPDLQNIFYDNKLFQSEDEKIELEERRLIKVRNAIILIQAHERARRARVYKATIKYDKSRLIVHTRRIDYQFTHPPMQPMSVAVKRTVYNAEFIKNVPECIESVNANENAKAMALETAELRRAQHKAATIIQSAWRAYSSWKRVRHKHVQKQLLLGMKMPAKKNYKHLVDEDIMDMYRRELDKARLDEEFIQLIEDERTRLLQERAPWIMEDISDHIRGWFRTFYDQTGAFHPYPDPIKTGTILVLRDETMDLKEFREKKGELNMNKEQKAKLREKEKQQKKKEKEKLKKEKAKEAIKRKKMKEAGIIDLAYEFGKNKYMQDLENTIKQYGVDWRFVDEYLNRNHEPIKDWVTQDELVKIHQELRLLVDEYMVLEYEMLQQAWCLDEGRAYTKLKLKKAKNKKKGKKKKQPVDITADRTLEELYNELKDGGFLVEKTERKCFNDFIAEFNFLADSTRDEDNLTTIDPTIGDIKMAVEQSIYGMGEFLTPKPKSMLLIGPFASGKRMLCQIIASELDALVIDLSPERTYNYDEEQLDYLIHVIMKVARAFQPTILYFEDVHRLFWKKIPPESEELKPQLLEKYIANQILKPIKKEDRILLLGTSDVPWNANGKLKRTFQKVIMIPPTDYGTAFLMWLEMLERTVPGNVEDYQPSVLAKVLRKYTTGDVVDNVEHTLSLKKRLQLGSKSLAPSDFLEYFIDRPEPMFPLDEKIMIKYTKWFNSSNKYAKMRAKYIKQKEEKNKKKK